MVLVWCIVRRGLSSMSLGSVHDTLFNELKKLESLYDAYFVSR